MKQRVLTSSAYGELVRKIVQNRKRYENGHVWIKDSPKYKDLFQQSDITIGSPLRLKLPDGQHAFDLGAVTPLDGITRLLHMFC